MLSGKWQQWNSAVRRDSLPFNPSANPKKVPVLELPSLTPIIKRSTAQKAE